jgi:hypothetical protein
MKATRFKCDIGNRPSGIASRVSQRIRFRMTLTGQQMKTFADDISLSHKYTPDAGVWVSRVPTIFGQP